MDDITFYGIERSLDELGRAVVPIEIARKYGIATDGQLGNMVELVCKFEEGYVIIRPRDRATGEGILRKIDRLNRVVIPKEFRDSVGMRDLVSVKFFRVNGELGMMSTLTTCAVCNTSENINPKPIYKEKVLCNNCIACVKQL